MQFIIRAYDGENSLDKRMAARPKHLENLTKIDGKLICGGGLLDDAGKMKGSIMIMEFDNREKLEQYLETEPYIVEHVWEKFDVENMNVVIVNGEKVGK